VSENHKNIDNNFIRLYSIKIGKKFYKTIAKSGGYTMKKRPFVIDCDTGTDDAIALIAALGCEEISVRAVTSVNGNSRERDTSRNNRNLMAHIGVDMEVTHGARHPFYPRGEYYTPTHGVTGFGDVELPEAEDYPFSKDMAPEAIRRIAGEENGELELLVLGPMTNIAIAINLYPELKTQIKHIWFMGGAIYGGNMTTSAEFNIWVDPIATRVVFDSGIPMTMIGLDVTEEAVMLPEDEQEMRKSGRKGAVVAADLLEYMFRRNQSGGEGALMHDALALAAAVCPECMTFERYFVDVDWVSLYTAGHTMVDVKRRSGREANMDVAVTLKPEVFRKWLTESILKCK